MILAALLIPILHPSIFLSPYNTTEKGEWIYAGAYLKTQFTGTSATLHFDASTNQGAPPKFRWSIDGQPLQTAQATRTLELAKNLPNKTHSLTLYLAASDANYNRWNTPTQIIRLESLELDNGATVKPPKNISKKQAIFFGDSITEGAWNLGDSFRVIDKKYVDWVQNSDATQAGSKRPTPTSPPSPKAGASTTKTPPATSSETPTSSSSTWAPTTAQRTPRLSYANG